MMINKRLIGMLDKSKKYVALNVVFQWISLAANIVMMFAVTRLLGLLFSGGFTSGDIIAAACVSAAALTVRFICTLLSSKMSFLSSKSVKKTLRTKIYEKLLSLGPSYNERVQTSEVVQVAVEGVDQLDTYFGAYLPQFFYAMLAPVTLFIVLCFVSIPCAVVLLICVPMIPVAIAAVQTWAKKLLSKYWTQYTALGDTFLENLQGLTTLKIYKADEYKNKEMNEQSEKFRKITMKVLTMQLNSITIMDFIAYGGAALGAILAATQYSSGKIGISQALFIILIAADFFIPMRRLGSFFHVAMNGMAASDKIFKLLDIPQEQHGGADFPKSCDIKIDSLSYSYDGKKQALNGVDMYFKSRGLYCVAGESGCGKSTLAAVLTGRNTNYSGSVKIGGVELSQISPQQLMKNITCVSFSSPLFKGSVRENLLMVSPQADDNALWSALKKVNLAGFLKNENGLDTLLSEGASNLSGGQRQRLALARALLHNSPIYIFDEATSNIDVESENDIMRGICALAETKCVILISHRLANTKNADKIYTLQNGRLVESGAYDELCGKGGVFAGLCSAQSELEAYTGGGYDE